jgi:hypothetical protein
MASSRLSIPLDKSQFIFTEVSLSSCSRAMFEFI